MIKTVGVKLQFLKELKNYFNKVDFIKWIFMSVHYKYFKLGLSKCYLKKIIRLQNLAFVTKAYIYNLKI